MTPLKAIQSGLLTGTQYRTLHSRMRRVLGQPTLCVECGNKKDARLEWANISGQYLETASDWEALCASCHRRKDAWGDAHKCKLGHELSEANTYIRPNGKFRECRECREEKHLVSNKISNKRRSHDP